MTKNILFKGQGIGGFIGGQLIDNAGCSLPLLFNVTAGFLFGWALIFHFVYAIFCKKYEEKLIQQKEEEIYRLQKSKRQDESTLSKIDQSQSELRYWQSASNITAKTKSTLEYEDSMKYWGSQIVGTTRL